MKEKISTYHIPFEGMQFEDMEFVPRKDTETSQEAIERIKSFKEKLAFSGLKRFRQSLQQEAA